MRAVLLVLLVACGRRAIAVPETPTPIRCDGEMDEAAWRSPARTGAFLDERGNAAAPYSEARFVRDAEHLYVGLYAADQDIRSDRDAFVLKLGTTTYEITPRGEVRPPVTGLAIGTDADGTVDDGSDDDEEWAIEAAFPLAAVPVAPDGTVDVELGRCDVPHDGIRRCGSWKGRLRLR